MTGDIRRGSKFRMCRWRKFICAGTTFTVSGTTKSRPTLELLFLNIALESTSNTGPRSNGLAGAYAAAREDREDLEQEMPRLCGGRYPAIEGKPASALGFIAWRTTWPSRRRSSSGSERSGRSRREPALDLPSAGATSAEQDLLAEEKRRIAVHGDPEPGGPLDRQSRCFTWKG